jgi:hypothetical protein
VLQRPAVDQPNSKTGSECVTCRQIGPHRTALQSQH